MSELKQTHRGSSCLPQFGQSLASPGKCQPFKPPDLGGYFGTILGVRLFFRKKLNWLSLHAVSFCKMGGDSCSFWITLLKAHQGTRVRWLNSQINLTDVTERLSHPLSVGRPRSCSEFGSVGFPSLLELVFGVQWRIALAFTYG